MNSLQEVESKIFDTRFKWSDIDREVALRDTGVLDLLREACLVESYFAVYTAKMMQLFWYDIQATSMYTIEAFEAYTHYYTLKRYLERVDYKTITDEEVMALRKKDLGKIYDNEAQELVNFMATEHFAAHFFGDLSKRAQEPVLVAMLQRMSKEEVVHARFAYDLLANRIADARVSKQEVLIYAKNFRHVGAYVLPQVSPVEEDNVNIIRGFAEMTEQLTGTSLAEFMALH